MEERQSVKVNIFGNEYTIRGEADPEYIQELARYVDGKMRDIATGAHLSVPLKVCILAAVNLADEVFRLRAARTPKKAAEAPILESKHTALAPEAISALAAHIDEALQEE